MELDTLKNIFLETMQQPVTVSGEKEVQLILKRSSRSEISKLKRNLRLELLFAVLFCVFPVFIFLKSQGLYVSLFSVMTFLIIAEFCIRISRILKAINRFEHASRAVKQHLRLLIHILKKFSRLYLQSTMLLIPILFTAAFVFIYLDNAQKNPLLFRIDYSRTAVVYSAAFICWSVGMYFFTKWYLNKIYGKHLQKLTEQLQEIENS
jgi:hypothetical protein